MIKLNEEFDVPVLEHILKTPEKIIQLPKYLYKKYKDYLIQEERYEDIERLECIKDKIINESLDDILGKPVWRLFNLIQLKPLN